MERRPMTQQYAAEQLLGDSLDWIDLDMVRFTMGCDDRLGDLDDDEGPTRDVSVGSMRVSATPVTVSAFAHFLEASTHVTDAERAGTGFRSTPNGRELMSGLTWRSDAGAPMDAVSQVSWVDAFEFCRWSSTRLLTEAEWERCARDDALSHSFLAGHLEWTADYYDPAFHRHEQRVNPTGPIGGTHRVARGGLTASVRTPLLPDMSSNDLFFRVVALR